MSAILGIYNINKEPVNTEHSKGMMKELQKYPYDRIAHLCNEDIFMGCLMQWVTPEASYEVLPYYDTKRELVITADAILDNRNELFEKLQVKREHQQKISDSALILLSYEKWKDECPKHFIGDFSFMIWDRKRQRLFGARDFSGARSMYYTFNHNRFVFSTTLSPILSLPFVDKTLNREWAAEFLAIFHQFDSVDTFITPYKHIQQLPPAHSISVCNGNVKLSRYYTFSSGDKLKLKTSGEYEEAFIDVLSTAVKARIRTPYQIGAQLSGGLDSSTIVSLAARQLFQQEKKLLTFSHVPVKDFVEKGSNRYISDETPLIKSTVNYVGNIKDFYLDLEGRNPFNEIEPWLDIIEMPYKFIENSFWIRGIYEKASQEGVRVLLSGARGNLTISWGDIDNHYVGLLRKMRLKKLNHELNMLSMQQDVPKYKIAKVLFKEAFSLLGNRNQREGSNGDFLPTLINPEFAKKTKVFKRIQDLTNSSSQSKSERRENVYKQLYGWNVVGNVSTRMSLQHSVMERDPTNDLRVIKFCFSVPEDQFVRNGLDRALVRHSMKRLLPEDVRLNFKRGIQAADWIHRMSSSWDYYVERLEKLCSDPDVAEFLNPEVLKNALNKARRGPLREYESDPDIRLSMRGLVFSKFISNLY